MSDSDIRVVLGIDFGTTYSGFAYSHKVNPDIITNQIWPPDSARAGALNMFKINTTLLYDKDDNVKSWGYKALANRRSKRRSNDSNDLNDPRPVELFKLYLGRDIKTSENFESLDEITKPDTFNYKKAITDYLNELGKVIKDTIKTRWYNLDFMQNVLIVLTVPAEFTDQAIRVMRECMFEAGLIDDLYSENLRFTTEPEAAAIYCRKVLHEHFEIPVGKSFLIVDCGGGTTDLTVRQLLDNNCLSEKTERSGDFCGGVFVDLEFVKFIAKKVGYDAMKSFREKHYGRYQYMIHEFFLKEKHQFNGNEETFDPIDFDLQSYCPFLIKYIADGVLKDRLIADEMVIALEFHHMKSFFDPVVNKIIRLIQNQLDNVDDCSAIFLVGGFSESKYLQNAIKKEFDGQVGNISVPGHPMLAVVKGAVEYGLNMKCVKNRVLKKTYGIKMFKGSLLDLFLSEIMLDEKVPNFHILATRGDEVNVDEEFTVTGAPLHSNSNNVSVELYETLSRNPKYIDEEGMELLRTIRVNVQKDSTSSLDHDPNNSNKSSSSSDSNNNEFEEEKDDNRTVKISLLFGELELKASVKSSSGDEKVEKLKLEF